MNKPILAAILFILAGLGLAAYASNSLSYTNFDGSQNHTNSLSLTGTANLVGTSGTSLSTVKIGTGLAIVSGSLTATGTVTNVATSGSSQSSGTAGYAFQSGTAQYAPASGTAQFTPLSGTSVYAATSGSAAFSGTSLVTGSAAQSGSAGYAAQSGTAQFSGTSYTSSYSGTAGKLASAISTTSSTAIVNQMFQIGATNPPGYPVLGFFNAVSGLSITSAGGGFFTIGGTPTASGSAAVSGSAAISGTAGTSGTLGLLNSSQFVEEFGNLNQNVYTTNTEIITGGTGSGFDSTYAFEASCVVEDNRLDVPYAVWSGTNGSIAMMTGPSLNSLSKLGVVLTKGTAGSWDAGYVSGPREFYYQGTYYMLFFGGPTNTIVEDVAASIGIATSTSGTGPWTQYSGNPILTTGSSGQWDDRILYRPCLLISSTGFRLFYNAGKASGGERIGFADATSIFGPYTKYSGNPIIQGTASWMSGNVINDPFVFPTKNGMYEMLATNSSNGTALYYSNDSTNWTLYNTSAALPVAGASTQVWRPELVSIRGSLFMLYDNGTTGEYYAQIKASDDLGASGTLPGPVTITGSASIVASSAGGASLVVGNSNAAGYPGIDYVTSGNQTAISIGHGNASAAGPFQGYNFFYNQNAFPLWFLRSNRVIFTDVSNFTDDGSTPWQFIGNAKFSSGASLSGNLMLLTGTLSLSGTVTAPSNTSTPVAWALS